ncbi:MAG: hypothetical protein ACK6CE_03850, partial [Planctomycetota bacterium]
MQVNPASQGHAAEAGQTRAAPRSTRAGLRWTYVPRERGYDNFPHSEIPIQIPSTTSRMAK